MGMFIDTIGAPERATATPPPSLVPVASSDARHKHPQEWTATYVVDWDAYLSFRTMIEDAPATYFALVLGYDLEIDEVTGEYLPHSEFRVRVYYVANGANADDLGQRLRRRGLDSLCRQVDGTTRVDRGCGCEYRSNASCPLTDEQRDAAKAELQVSRAAHLRSIAREQTAGLRMIG